jgi:protein-L-isoaspartate(D-aspartate) O-methyltransferase
VFLVARRTTPAHTRYPACIGGNAKDGSMSASGFDAGIDDPAALRRALVDKLVREGVVRGAPIEAAFRAVPRHLFLPGVPLAKVYGDTSIATKTVGDQMISSSSQPSMMAIMLEQLQLQPGHHVLEIGAGTGYNAALIAHVVGDRGKVVTIDIDDDIADAARAHLSAAGYTQAIVLCGDGGNGYAAEAPYDRIIVTVGADDIPPAWRDQLRPDGRLVVPLGLTELDRLSGHKLLAAFDRVDGYLDSRSLSHCRFVPLRGAFGARGTAPLLLNAKSEVRLVTAANVHAAGLIAVLAKPSRERSVDVDVYAHELHGLRLWLALHEPGFCDLLTPDRDAGQKATPMVATGLCHDSTLALLTSAHGLPSILDWPTLPYARHTLLVRSFGPDDEPAQRLIAQVVAWDRARRPFCQENGDILGGVVLRAFPAGTPYQCAPNEVALERRSTRLVFSWR